MKWQREDEFKEVLDKAVKKGSKAAITTAQGIAVQDMAQVCIAMLSCLGQSTQPLTAKFCAQGYKHVCALVDRHLKKAKPAQRLNAFFLISAICRHSLKKYKLQDKYSAFLLPASCHKLHCKVPATATLLLLQQEDGLQALQSLQGCCKAFLESRW